MNKNRSLILFGLLALAVVVVSAAPFWGMETIPVGALWGRTDDAVKIDILWKLRIPRVAMAFLAGAALATSGMSFQAMFRNPLATPFTLGISSGASLGAALCIQLGWNFSLLWIPGVTLSAFMGAVITIVLVYTLTTRAPKGSTTATMLLAGVAISFFFSSLILFLQYMSDFSRSYRMIRWVMGGMENVVDFGEVLTVLPFVATGCLIIAFLTHELNLMLLGEDFAASRGVAVNFTRMLLYFAVSLMVGAVVAFCGPIGFVGLMAPHICRLLVGADHRRLFPATWLLGGTFLVICDSVGRTIMAPAELPVGVITALLGGPFFLWLLFGRKSGFHEL
ncbi:MAG: iron ABC transporter permease [Thermoguttaceae bacterium]|jgi:iron complex transport system permease protein